ncbi:hypothetical protein HYQ46_002497 [Verticillium longisporum]|nr:hypothetical protein HYQ46_002497 [Verticillium longisporum]
MVALSITPGQRDLADHPSRLWPEELQQPASFWSCLWAKIIRYTPSFPSLPQRRLLLFLRPVHRASAASQPLRETAGCPRP